MDGSICTIYLFWLFVNSWGGIRMNPALFLRLELFQWFILLYAVFEHAK